jgi:(p)ppGpp synthase/HD superfamily hydrolase
MEPLTFARSYATLHHVIRKGQLYGVVPYTHHLAAVEEVLREFGESRSEMLVAAWLHDIVEDTDVKLRDIEENFGPEVATLVGAVTSESGENRKIRNALTYPKIRDTGQDAVRLKLADRIANVRNGGSSVMMYAKEHKNFKHALYSQNDDGNRKMWSELDQLLYSVAE